MPGLAQVDLVWVADSGGGIDDDFVAYEQDGFWPGFVWCIGTGSRFLAGIEGFEVGGDAVEFAEDDVGEHDRGV